MKIPERRTTLGDEQAPARFAVQPMHQVELTEFRSRRAQSLDRAMRKPAAPVHRESRGLVDCDQVGILVEDRVGHRPQQVAARPRRRERIGSSNRGQAHAVARGDALVRTRPLAVDTHFTLPQQAIHMCARHTLEYAEEKVVEALTGITLACNHVAHRRRRGGLLGAGA